MIRKSRIEGSSSFNAEEMDIRNVAGDYIDNSTALITNVHLNSRSSAMNLLVAHISPGSIHDSDIRCDAPRCHPETRIGIQGQIMSWIRKGNNDKDPKQMTWITGPAGAGKTAIAGSICESCREEGLLAASYFFSSFSGTAVTRIKTPFVATLAYQLILHQQIVGLKDEILAVIQNDPSIFTRRLDRQLAELVLRPLQLVANRSPASSWPQVVIVDGLDECDVSTGYDLPGGQSRVQIHLEILSVLARASRDPYFPFRIVVASRPEPAIRQFFDSSTPSIALELFLDEKYDPDSDITLFLTANLSEIRRRCKLPSSWASHDFIQNIVKKASGQFIYAATVIRFIGYGTMPPQYQLDVVLQEHPTSDHLNPFASLDALYTRVLRTSPDPELAALWLCTFDRYGLDGPSYIRILLESYEGETEHLLGNLTSIIRVTEFENFEFWVEYYHSSFLDFLRNPSRSVDLYVSEASLEQFVKDRYYAVLRNRGPEGRTQSPFTDITHRICRFSIPHLDVHRDYVDRDIQWWIQVKQDSELRQLENLLQYAFVRVHEECQWHRCLPACKVWRWVILSYCKRHTWRVPTKFELFRDRFWKFKYFPFDKDKDNGRCVPLYKIKRTEM